MSETKTLMRMSGKNFKEWMILSAKQLYELDQEIEAELVEMGCMQQKETMKPILKVLHLDLECSNLTASYGFILCCGYQWDHEDKVKMLSLRDYPGYKKDPTNDKNLVKDIVKLVAEADIVVTWYGDRYDIPFVTTRLLKHKLAPLPPFKSLDLWRTSKFQLKMHSNRLLSVSEMLGTKERKNAIKTDEWNRAISGHIPSMKYVELHCRKDIKTLRETYKRLYPIIKGLPIMRPFKYEDFPECPECSNIMQSRGRLLAEKSWRRRFYCYKCNRWVAGKIRKY